MTLSVDASSAYRMTQGQNSQQNPRETQNFRQHLGLDNRHNPELKVVEEEVEQPQLTNKSDQQPTWTSEPVLPTELNQNQSMSLVLSPASQGQMQPAAELYPLSWHATAHLSYIQHAYADGTELQIRVADQASAIMSATSTESNESSLSLQAVNVLQGSLTQPHDYQPKESGLTKSRDSATASLLLSHYLAEKWPMRRIQVTQQGQDIQVLVRDYQLTDTEIDHLTTTILIHMKAQGNSPARIWINGHSVWAAANQQLSKGENNHGS